jgi:hypothetical protein
VDYTISYWQFFSSAPPSGWKAKARREEKVLKEKGILSTPAQFAHA